MNCFLPLGSLWDVASGYQPFNSGRTSSSPATAGAGAPGRNHPGDPRTGRPFAFRRPPSRPRPRTPPRPKQKVGPSRAAPNKARVCPSVCPSANSPTFLISRECLLVSGGTNREKEKYTAGATGGGRGALGLAPWVAWRLKTPIRRPSPPLKETASLERHDSTLPRRAPMLSVPEHLRKALSSGGAASAFVHRHRDLDPCRLPPPPHKPHPQWLRASTSLKGWEPLGSVPKGPQW